MSDYRKIFKNSFKRGINKTSIRNFINKVNEEYYLNLPTITEKPTLSKVGLTEEMLKQNDEFKKNRALVVDIITFIIFLILCFLAVFYCFKGSANDSIVTTIDYLKTLPWIAIVLGPIYYIFAGDFANKIKNAETKIDSKYYIYKICLDGYNRTLELKKREYWLKMNGREFEIAVANLFKCLGYNSQLTQYTSDGGVDIVLTKDGETIFVQCKAFKNNVGIATARELYGVMQDRGVNKGIIATLNGFTQGVYDFAKDKNIDLISLDDILKITSEKIIDEPINYA